MNIRVQVTIEHEQTEYIETVTVLRRDELRPETLGITLHEGQDYNRWSLPNKWLLIMNNTAIVPTAVRNVPEKTPNTSSIAPSLANSN